MKTYVLAMMAALLTTIGAVLAGEATTQPSSAWADVGGDAASYAALKQPEQIFTGTLRSVKEAEMSIVMRSHRYQLNDRYIAPGIESPELDKLVGQNVEIKGKPSDFELEGHSISEITPVAIRSAAPSTQPATRPIAFDTYGGYFVSNKFEPDSAESYAIIKDQQAFDQIFGVGRVMNDKSHRLPADVFNNDFVLTVIKRGKAMVTFNATDVSENNGVLTVSYTTTEAKSDSAEFSCPLIVSMPKGDYTAVEFVENGKLARKL